MSGEDELFEKVKILNQQNIEIYEKYCALLKKQTSDTDVTLMKAIVHNKVLLMVILSKLGMEDEEIDNLNERIYTTLDERIKDFAEGAEDEKANSN